MTTKVTPQTLTEDDIRVELAHAKPRSLLAFDCSTALGLPGYTKMPDAVRMARVRICNVINNRTKREAIALTTPDTLTWGQVMVALESEDKASLVRELFTATLDSDELRIDIASQRLCDAINGN